MVRSADQIDTFLRCFVPSYTSPAWIQAAQWDDRQGILTVIVLRKRSYGFDSFVFCFLTTDSIPCLVFVSPFAAGDQAILCRQINLSVSLNGSVFQYVQRLLQRINSDGCCLGPTSTSDIAFACANYIFRSTSGCDTTNSIEDSFGLWHTAFTSSMTMFLRGLDALRSFLVCAAGSTRCATVCKPEPPLYNFSIGGYTKCVEDACLIDLRKLSASQEHPQLELITASIKQLPTQSIYILFWLLFCLPRTLEYCSDMLGSLPSIRSSDDPLYPSFAFTVHSKEQTAFAALKRKYGCVTAYHGTRSDSVYSILANGLKNLSYSRQMTSGAAFGQGVYLAADLKVAKTFAHHTGNIPTNSLFCHPKSRSHSDHMFMRCKLAAVFVCDVIAVDCNINSLQSFTKPTNPVQYQDSEMYYIVQDPSHIRIRSLLLYEHG